MPSDERADIDHVADMIEAAEKQGLAVEVVLQAIYEAKGNPSLSVADVCSVSLFEWDI